MSVDSEFLLRALGIVVIDLAVAGDNALVIALAVRRLPARQQVMGRIFGTLGAAVLRLLFIFAVTFLLDVPFLQMVGGLALIWIAVMLVRQPPARDAHTREAGTLREAIWIIVVADAVMSLDNVLAVAAAAHGDFTLALFGIALSLPIVVWGSGLVSALMDRHPWTVWLGGGVLGYVAGEMIVDDRAVHAWLHGVGWLLPLALTAVVAAVGWLAHRRRVAPSRPRGPGRRHR